MRAVAAAALALTALLTPGFLSTPSLLSLLTTVSFIGCVAIGMTLITISGNIMSFSLGALVGATAMVFVLALNFGGLVFAFVAALVFAALINAAQGLVIGAVRANPIIVSIAATALIYGVAEGFAEHGAIYAPAGINYGIFHGKVWGLPVEFVVFLGATAVAQLLLSCTIFGRNVFMTGSSAAAAEIIGVRTWRTVTGAYLWAGLFAGLAGMMLAMRYDFGLDVVRRRLRIRCRGRGPGRRHGDQGRRGVGACARLSARSSSPSSKPCCCCGDSGRNGNFSSPA